MDLETPDHGPRASDHGRSLRHAPYGRPVRIIMGIMIARVFKTSAGSIPAT
jgi:hypothetical protein